MSSSEKSKKYYDVAVIGGGLVGMTATLALGIRGLSVLHLAPKPSRKDTRTTAFLWQTVAFFEQLGIWQELRKNAFPLEVMRIVDGTNRLFRAPQTDFKASEIELEAFGYNLVNWQVIELLEKNIAKFDSIDVVSAELKDITPHASGYELHVTGQSDIEVMNCGFLIGADGRNSFVRETLFPGVRDWSYPQEAIVLDFEHEYPTMRTSTEFHTESGPFTIVPQSDHKAGLVWMETPERVQEITALSKEKLEELLEGKMQSFLGKISLAGDVASFPIKGLVANRFGEADAVIVGEAAHVFPPIGAQGFNLGVRDIQSALEVLGRHTNTENRGARYDGLRRSDIQSRTMGVDLLNRSLLSGFLPNQMARSFGLYALGNISPLRKMVMKQGISPAHRLGG